MRIFRIPASEHSRFQYLSSWVLLVSIHFRFEHFNFLKRLFYVCYLCIQKGVNYFKGNICKCRLWEVLFTV